MRRRAWIALVVVLALVVLLVPGAGGRALRLALGPGLVASLAGSFVGWVVAGVGYWMGDRVERFLTRSGVALLALPAVALGPLLAHGGLAGVLGALVWMRVWQAAVLLTGQTRALGTSRFVEAAEALGAGRGRIYLRQFSPWLLPATLALGMEGAVLVIPFDLLFGLIGAGSAGLGTPVAEALRHDDRGPLVAASVASVVVAISLVTLAARVRRWASRHEGEG